jgi:hypothetical protein
VLWHWTGVLQDPAVLGGLGGMDMAAANQTAHSASPACKVQNRRTHRLLAGGRVLAADRDCRATIAEKACSSMYRCPCPRSWVRGPLADMQGKRANRVVSSYIQTGTPPRNLSPLHFAIALHLTTRLAFALTSLSFFSMCPRRTHGV